MAMNSKDMVIGSDTKQNTLMAIYIQKPCALHRQQKQIQTKSKNRRLVVVAWCQRRCCCNHDTVHTVPDGAAQSDSRGGSEGVDMNEYAPSH